MTPISVQELVGTAEQRGPLKSVTVDIGGDLPLPVRVMPATRPSKTLIVLFHGAIDRSTRQLPSFLDYRFGLEAHAHQLAISDPSLALDDELSNTWFCGSAGTPLQRLLPEFLRELGAEMDIRRMIFVGSSGGGFGALFYSWHVPDSIAVVTVPQTNVWEYYEPRRTAFLNACWPDGVDGEDAPILDLRERYATPSTNGVVYLQSSLDAFHLSGHALPFLSSLAKPQLTRTAVKVSYWGRPGHSSAVPLEEWDGWLQAALTSPDTSAENIVSAYHRSGVEIVPSAALKKSEQIAARQAQVSGAAKSASHQVSDQDKELANLVVRAQLGRKG